MKVLNLQQGTPEWLEARAKYRTASEASAMMSASPYLSRDDLLRQKATGEREEVSAAKQALFDRGHKAEAAARPKAEDIIGAELYPVTGLDTDGLLSASFDGLTMDGSIAWEHKLWNEGKADAVKAGRVPNADYWQLVHQLYVSGAQKVLYMVSDSNDSAHVWLTAEQVEASGDFDRLLAGWAQFEDDLANYAPDATVEVTAEAIEQLPALSVELVGEVKSTNLATYKDVVAARIEAINTDLQTDQDFADAEQMVKFLDSGEKELETVKKQALGQTASIDELFRTLDHLRESMRQKRLELNKLVKARKESIRLEIRNTAQAEVDAHIAKINESLGGKITLPVVTPDFAGAMKGKKTVASLRSACNDLVAATKIEVSEIGDRIRKNLDLLREEADGVEFLFNDAQTLVTKEPEDFANLVKARIAQHREVEAEKARQAEAERQAEKEQFIEQQSGTAEPEEVTTDKPASGTVDLGPGYGPVEIPGAIMRASIIRLVADAYSISEAEAERKLFELFATREAA